MNQDALGRVMWNYRIATLEGMCISLTIGLVLPFLPVAVMAMGGSDTLVGLVTALPALVNTFLMVPASRIAARAERKLPLVVWSCFANRIFYLFLAAVPFLPGYRAELTVLLVGLMALPAVLTVVGWTNLMGKIFPSSERARLFSRRSAWCGAISLLGTLIGGPLIDRVPFPYNFSLLFGLAWLGAMGSTWILTRHIEDPVPVDANSVRPFLGQLRSMMADAAYGRRFTVFIASAFVFHVGLNYGVPLFSIYWVRELHLSASVIGWFTILSGLTTVASAWWWGQYLNRRGNDRGLALAFLGMGIFPIAVVLEAHPTYLLAANFAVGFFIAGFNLALFNLLLESTRPEYNAAAVGTFHTLMGASGVLAPFAATALLPWIPAPAGLALSGALRLAGLLLLVIGFGLHRDALRRLVPGGPARRPPALPRFGKLTS